MVTVSLVLYKTPKNQIDNVLKSINNSVIVSKLYIIDNSPNEQNQSFFSKLKNVEYIPHENTGYGASHNVAIKKAIESGSDYHLVINPDIEFDSDVLSKLVDYMEQNVDTVYMLPKVIYPSGEIQYLCKLLPSPMDLIFRRFFSKNKLSTKKDYFYTLKHSGYNKIINPPCLSGCFMFLRVSTLRENNILFDERYFMYLEDFDLMRRLHKVGKTIFFPEVSIIHNHMKESYTNKKMLFTHIKSAIKYFNKWGWFFDKERKQMNRQILLEIQETL